MSLARRRAPRLPTIGAVNLLNADLHCHSVVSDGTLQPEALAERAKTNGVELWSLTDHDEVDGQPRAAAAARALGLDYLSGCEISVSFAGTTVHIVGLGFDATDRALQRGPGRHARRPRRACARDVRRPGQGGHQGRIRRCAEVRRQPRADFAHPLRPLPGRDRHLRATPTRSSAATSPKASPATCRTAGPRWAMRCAGSRRPAAWR